MHAGQVGYMRPIHPVRPPLFYCYCCFHILKQSLTKLTLNSFCSSHKFVDHKRVIHLPQPPEYRQVSPPDLAFLVLISLVSLKNLRKQKSVFKNMHFSVGIIVILNNCCYLIFGRLNYFMVLSYYVTEGNDIGPEGPQQGIIKTAQRALRSQYQLKYSITVSIGLHPHCHAAGTMSLL